MVVGKDRPDARILVSGDYPALESVFVKEVRSARELDPFNPLLILVSSKLLGLHLRRLLAEQGLPHFNLRFFKYPVDACLEMASSFKRRREVIPLMDRWDSL